MANPDPEVARQFLQGIQSELPERERLVLQMKMDGATTAQIAEALAVSHRTVHRIWMLVTRRIRPRLEQELQIAEERVSPTTLPVYVDPGEAPAELIAELFVALACAYRSVGGSGLQVTRDDRRTFVAEVL